MGAKKSFRPKNDGTDHLYHHAKFGGNRAMKCDVFHFFISFYF